MARRELEAGGVFGAVPRVAGPVPKGAVSGHAQQVDAGYALARLAIEAEGVLGLSELGLLEEKAGLALHYSRRSRISHRRGLLDRERSLSDMAAGAAGGVAWPSRHRAVAEARWGEGSAGTGGAARDRDVRRAPRRL